MRASRSLMRIDANTIQRDAILKDASKLIHLGRPPAQFEGTVNHPVYRASTILSTDIKTYLGRHDGDRRYVGVTYGAAGTHNARALAEAVNGFEEGAGTVITGTGLSAITVTLAALTKAGDHLLITDSVYGPTRNFCNNVLARYGVETTFYDPTIGAGIADLIQDNTRLIYTEAPGSLTFEMQDIPAIVKAAKARDVLVAMDNTWATPLYFKPIPNGVDISIQAGTKYFAGHSDLVIGMVTCATDELYRRIIDERRSFGDTASADDCFLTLRGMRSLHVRLTQQSAAALKVAQWLEQHPAVARVLYPALPSDPGHALFARDFSGASSLMGLVLKSQNLDATARFIDDLEMFRIGSSWGGYESLIVANNGRTLPRDAVPWTTSEWLLRVHVGLEDPDDLIDDLTRGFERM